MNNLPDFLKLSPEKVAENNQRDAELRKKLNSRLKMSPFEQERARAIVSEDAQRKSVRHLADIVTLAKKVASAGIGDVSSAGVEEAQTQKIIAKENLAENLAAQGKFLDAARQTPDNDTRKYYRRVAEAIWKDDDDLCDCPAPTAVLNHKEVTLPKYRIVRKVYSLRDAAEVNLLECVVCGSLNARPLTADLQAIETAKQTATAEKPITDAEIFGGK